MKKTFLAAVLTLVSGSSFAAITDTCQQYFDDVDALIVQASKHPVLTATYTKQ